MSEFGALVGDGVRFERALEAPPDQVWAYLTQSELISDWLGSGEIDLKVGGRVELRSGGPVIRGLVLDCGPPRLLSYTWNVFMPGDDAPVTLESVVRWELRPQGEGTVLTLTQSPIAPEFLSRSAAGWHVLLDILAARLAETMPPDFVDTFHRVHPEYEKLAT